MPLRLRLAGIALALLAVAGGGALLGWTALSRHEAARAPEAPPPPAAVNLPSLQPGVQMPDVRGLARATALQVIADAGIAASAVTVTERPAAGPVGDVVEQEPAFGVFEPTAVTLVAATEATVPEVAGRPAVDVASDLGALGAQVTRQRSYSAGAPAGTVLSVDPPPGSPVPATVTVQVAEPASSVFLSTLRADTGACSEGSVSLGGTTYGDSLSCSATSTPRPTLWVVGPEADQVVGTVGVPDDGEPGTQVRVEVFADGASRGAVTASFGKPAAIDVSLAGAIQLSITVQRLDDPPGYSNAEVALADVRLVGSADAISSLEKP